MRVSRPRSQILIVTKRRLFHIGLLAFSLGFFALWYYNILGLGDIPNGVHPFDHVRARLVEQPFLWLFVLGPVLGVPQMFKALRIGIVGEAFTFNGMSRTVLKNHKRLVGFNEIAHLQVRMIQGESQEHRLTAVLHTGDKIEIHNSSNASDIIALADDIADMLGVSVVRRE